MRLQRVTVWMWAVCVGICGIMSGCGEGEVVGGSMQDTGERFAAALASGDFGRAAEAFDYATLARQQTQDWDDIATAQRNLIMREMAEQKIAFTKAAIEQFSRELEL